MTADLVRFYIESGVPPEKDGSTPKAFFDVPVEKANQEELFLICKNIQYTRIDL